MVMTIIEPIFAGIMVSLINKYVLNNLGYLWSACEREEPTESQEDGEEGQTKHREADDDEHEAVSSQNTTISDAVHVHCHHF